MENRKLAIKYSMKKINMHVIAHLTGNRQAINCLPVNFYMIKFEKWENLDLGNTLLFSNLFSRCLFSIISVVGTQNDWIPGISELANLNKEFGDNICPVPMDMNICPFV